LGRQIQFHMMPDDLEAFIRAAQQSDPVVVTDREHPCDRGVHPTSDLRKNRLRILCLWNRRLLPELNRDWHPEAKVYKYWLDVFRLPVLELSTCLETEWDGMPALIQGRLYGVFDRDLRKPPEFEKWFDRLVRWIRKNYKRRDTIHVGGYVGPAADQFLLKGGYLLPGFRPPRTDVWLAEMRKQHPLERD
jgi:hypothetical protein